MEEIESKKEEKPRRRSKAICRETVDHIHRPPATRHLKTKRAHHAPSPIQESISRVTRNTKYGQCMKNQAGDIGATAYDGCGEFVSVSTGDDSLDCAACGCHRRFHKEESLIEGVSEEVLEKLKISSDEFRKIFCSPYGERKKEGVSGGVDRLSGGDLAAGRGKRFKTKFTAEQTEKMRNYAEKLRWKMNPENRKEVDEFCVEIGVDRKKFGNWMNNHKG